MVERFALCKEFGWTPAELDTVPFQEIEDYKQILTFRRTIEEREQKMAERRSQRG